MKSIPFPLLRKSNRYLACGTPFLRYAEFVAIHSERQSTELLKKLK